MSLVSLSNVVIVRILTSATFLPAGATMMLAWDVDVEDNEKSAQWAVADIQDIEERLRTMRLVCRRFKDLIDQVFVEVMYFAWGRHLRSNTIFYYTVGGHSFDEQIFLDFPTWDAYVNQFRPFLERMNRLDTPAYHEPLPEFDWVPPALFAEDFEDRWREGKVQRKKLKL